MLFVKHHRNHYKNLFLNRFHTKSADINEERTCALCLEILPKSNNKKICDSCIKKHNFTPVSGAHQASSSAQSKSNEAGSTTNIDSIPIQCNLCKKIQLNAYKLQEHLIEHTFQDCGSSSNGYVCYICTSIFTSASGLQQHIHQEHEKNDMDKNIKPYDCHICDAKYFFRTELEHHLFEHEKSGSSNFGKFETESSAEFEEDPRANDELIKIEKKSEKDEDSRCGGDSETEKKDDVDNVLIPKSHEEEDEYIEVEKITDTQK